MAKNPLGDGKNPPREDRSKWSLQRHCEHANQQLIDKGINEDRRRMGLFSVKWIIADGRVVITEGVPREALRIAAPLN